MTAKHHGLGKGFGALVDSQRARPVAARPKKGELFVCAIRRIHPNPRQPRQRFDEAALQTLAASIARDGLLQPLAVRPKPGGDDYELIAGERRLRAAKAAGLAEVPCVLIETDDEGLGVLSLIENLMREDLNPLDEAEAYQRLTDEFDLTQERIAERVGKSRVHVTNTIRLLGLPEVVRAYLAAGELTAGHGRAILGLEVEAERIAVARAAIEKGLSVRETEALVQHAARLLRRAKANKGAAPKEHPYANLADDLRTRLATKVRFTGGKKRGTIERRS
jgi:ParB family chromosome partitioning protein